MSDTNRANHIVVEEQFRKGVDLIDIDTTIANYMTSKVIPDLVENDLVVKIPLIYGNSERWEGARKQGYLRDVRGKIQMPVIMFKRNTIERDSSMQHFREQLTAPAFRKYSTTNRYDRFTLMSGVKPTYEQYSVSMPAYVTITYEVVAWTAFTEHMNKIVEAFQYATDRYWGDPEKYKFRVRIDNFDNAQELGEGTERVIRTTFTLSVNAYLLPDTFDKTPTVKKTFSTKRIIVGVETDLTGTGLGGDTLYNEYGDAINFVAIRGSKMADFVNCATAVLTNVFVPVIPTVLLGSFDINNTFSIYVNGNFVNPNEYTYTYSGTSVTFAFTGLGFNLESSDEIAVTGKFQEL